jgi:hypothetical protein
MKFLFSSLALIGSALFSGVVQSVAVNEPAAGKVWLGAW